MNILPISVLRLGRMVVLNSAYSPARITPPTTTEIMIFTPVSTYPSPLTEARARLAQAVLREMKFRAVSFADL